MTYILIDASTYKVQHMIYLFLIYQFMHVLYIIEQKGTSIIIIISVLKFLLILYEKSADTNGENI